MKIKLRHIIMMLMFAMFLTGNIYAHERLKLNAGTMTTGGQFLVPYSYGKDGIHQLKVLVNPKYGYFIVDKLELNLSLDFGTRLYWSKVRVLTGGLVLWGATLGGSYYFDLNAPVFPFISAELSAQIPNISWGGTTLNIGLPLGILWALNEHVGLNFGVKAVLELSSFSSFEAIHIIPGYVGITAFF